MPDEKQAKQKIVCEQCGKTLLMPPGLAGKRVKCPKCTHVFRVPEPAEVTVPELDDDLLSELDTMPMSASAPAPLSRPTSSRDSVASDPGRFSLSREKLQVLYPNFYSLMGFLTRLIKMSPGNVPSSARAIEQHLREGDSRAAVVISTDPLLVAAYSDERDCVVMLKFPPELVELYGLKAGTRLLTVNTYMKGPQRPAADLIEGPKSMGRWHNVVPQIADFLSDDRQAIAARKAAISKDEWQRAGALGLAYLQKNPDKARDGRPLDSWKPCITTWF